MQIEGLGCGSQSLNYGTSNALRSLEWKNDCLVPRCSEFMM